MMKRSDLKKLIQLGDDMWAAKQKDYRVDVSYSITEPTAPTYSLLDDDDVCVAWALSVDDLIASVRKILPKELTTDSDRSS